VRNKVRGNFIKVRKWSRIERSDPRWLRASRILAYVGL